MNLGAENNRFDTGYFKDLDVENGIMGGGGVKQTTLYTWDGSINVSSIGSTCTIMLSEDSSNYDYLVVTAQSNTGTRIQTVVIDANNFDFSSYLTTRIENAYFTLNFYLNEESNPKECTYSLLSITSDIISSVHIQSVVGIKYIDPDIKNATSLDETLLYSGNDLVTSTSGAVSYTLSDNYNNYDYIILEIVAPSSISSAVNYCTITVKMPLGSTLHHPIFSPSTYNPTVDTRYDFNGFVEFNNDNVILFGPRFMGSDISGVILSKVIGIKKNSLSTADIAYMAMPSDVNVTIPDVIDDSTYTATANGLVLVQAISSSSSLAAVYIRTLDGSSNIIRTSRNINYGSTGSIFCSHMVAKGDTIGFGLVGCTASSVKFFYSVGDAKALGLL